MAAKFEIKKAKDGEFFFHLKAANGEIILTSEMYRVKASAKNGIASVKKNAPDDKRYQRKETHNGHQMFNLKAGNHEVIGTSQSYSSAEARDHGIESVKKKAPAAEVDDVTNAKAQTA
jgi:uncharacterized protein YegP (UPF0339 family)